MTRKASAKQLLALRSRKGVRNWRTALRLAGFKKGQRTPYDLDNDQSRYSRRVEGKPPRDIVVLWPGEVQLQTPYGEILIHAASIMDVLKDIDDLDHYNVVFLDIDGVLTGSYYTGRHRGRYDIDPAKVELLKQILGAFPTYPRVVISSVWRKYPEDRERIRFKGINRFGVTPRINEAGHILGWPTHEDPNGWRRATEIAAWLKLHPGANYYVVLDDESLIGQYEADRPAALEVEQHLVKTAWKTGMLPEHVTEAVAMLGKKLPETRLSLHKGQRTVGHAIISEERR